MELESIDKSLTYPISLDELETKADKFINKGYHTLAIYSHGIARSFKHAEHLSKDGQPALFLEGGFSELSTLHDAKTKSRLIKTIRHFPNREFLLTAEEIRNYSELICQIGGCIVKCDFENNDNS